MCGLDRPGSTLECCQPLAELYSLWWATCLHKCCNPKPEAKKWCSLIYNSGYGPAHISIYVYVSIRLIWCLQRVYCMHFIVQLLAMHQQGLLLAMTKQSGLHRNMLLWKQTHAYNAREGVRSSNTCC